MLAGLRLSRLLPPAAAIATGATLLLAANFALSGQLVWTPGGFGIAFGRMLEDGLVKRYLDDHCPDARLKLCPYRSELPRSADEFLWSYGIFNELGASWKKPSPGFVSVVDSGCGCSSMAEQRFPN